MTTAHKPDTMAEIRELLTRQQAAERQLVPHGHVWDEESQQPIPLGLAIRDDQLRRDEDLEARLKRMARDRKILLRFVAEQMVESEYDKSGKPIKGKMHDYYRLAGYDKKCPTKQGGEKLAQFFSLRRSKTESVERVCTREFAMAFVRVELVDRWGHPAGSGEAAATTAESGFQAAAAKYGQRRDRNTGEIVQEADWRAATNDIVSRGGKRAFNQAVIYATATDDIFDATGEMERKAEEDGVDDETPPKPRQRFPAKGWGSVSGMYLDETDTGKLTEVRQVVRARDPAKFAVVIEAINEELERRRLEAEDELELPV